MLHKLCVRIRIVKSLNYFSRRPRLSSEKLSLKNIKETRKRFSQKQIQLFILTKVSSLRFFFFYPFLGSRLSRFNFYGNYRVRRIAIHISKRNIYIYIHTQSFTRDRALLSSENLLPCTQGHLAFFETVSCLVPSRLSREFSLGLFTILTRTLVSREYVRYMYITFIKILSFSLECFA